MSVSIIGGGPCGLGVARALITEGMRAQVFESQSEFGGVWNYTGKGPLYRDLNTNLQTDLMMFKDHPFPPNLPDFPFREDVCHYARNYSKEVEASVHFNTTITYAAKEKGKWFVRDSNGKEYTSDFLVVAAGHCNFPFFPPIKGLDPQDSRVTHSRYFDEPSPFKGGKVLFVGNSASAVDLAIQVLSVTDKVLISRRHEGAQDHFFEEYVQFKPEISEITKDSVKFVDGTTESPEFIVFCTGYLYKFPFLDKFNHARQLPLLHPNRVRLVNLYRGLFYLDDPTLAFIAMDKNIVPMPLSEHQGAALARVWNDRLQLPSKEEMLELEAKRVAEKGDSAAYHSLGSLEDVSYMLGLAAWVDTAGPKGFFAEKWDEEKIISRKNVAATKGEEIKRRLDTIPHR